MDLDILSTDVATEGFLDYFKKFFTSKPRVKHENYLDVLAKDGVDRWVFDLYDFPYGFGPSGNYVKIGRQMIDKYLNPSKEDLSTKFKGYTIQQAIDTFDENCKILTLIMELADEYVSGNTKRNFDTELKKLKIKYVPRTSAFPYKSGGIGKPTTVGKSGWFDKKKQTILYNLDKRFCDLEETYSTNYWEQRGPLDDDFIDTLTEDRVSDKLMDLSDASEHYYEVTLQRHHYAWLMFASVEPIAHNLGMREYGMDTVFIDGVPANESTEGLCGYSSVLDILGTVN